MNKNFRTLLIAKDFYHACNSLKLSYSMKDQLIRASSSVALNLAEGSARTSNAEKRRFFNIAYASLKESECILELVAPNNTALLELANRLGGMLYNLVRFYTEKGS